MPRMSIGIAPKDSYWAGLDVWKVGLVGYHTTPEMINQFYKEVFYYGYENIDAVVIQLGIVDCCPRSYPLSLRRLLSSYPFIVRGLKKLRRLDIFRFTSISDFKCTYERLLQTLSAKKIQTICISILPVPISLKNHDKMQKSVDDYNAVITESARAYCANVIDVADKTEFVTDDLHLTKEGHRWIATEIRMLKEK